MKFGQTVFARCGAMIAILVGLLGCGLAGAQEYSPDVKAALIASPEIERKLELKDGRTYTYRQLVELPESDRKALLALAEKRSERGLFLDWELAVYETILEEQKKSLAATLARTAEKEKSLAVTLAREAEKDKSIAALEARGKILDKELADSYTRMAVGARIALGAGKKISVSYQKFSKSVASISDLEIKAGLSKVDADFLKSLLQRPELFENP